jgi:hypothetical protein
VDESIQISISEFATLKIRGLRNRAEIRRHRKAWQLAIEHGLAVDVKPGDTITLPDAEWSDYFNCVQLYPHVYTKRADMVPLHDYPSRTDATAPQTIK